MKKQFILFSVLVCNAISLFASNNTADTFDWRGASVYFVITDRFCNGDTTNDINYGRIVDIIGGISIAKPISNDKIHRSATPIKCVCRVI